MKCSLPARRSASRRRDDFGVEHIHGEVVQVDDYYPFGLAFNLYNRENSTAQNLKYNGVENEDKLGLNINTTFFRMHDPTLGRWWQIDPKPREDMTLYATMGNNPTLYSDPLGDTTRIYSTAGKLLTTIDDSHENQAHFVNKKQFNKMTQGENESVDDYSSRVRNSSVAFIGKNTIADMQGIVGESNSLNKEIGFVGVISGTREIRLEKLPVDEGNGFNHVDLQAQIDEKYGSDQSKLFLFGHVHHKGLVSSNLHYPTDADKAWRAGTPSGTPNPINRNPAPTDYYQKLRNSTGTTRPSPGMVATPYGYSLYPSVGLSGERPNPSDLSRERYRFYKAGKVK